MCVCVQVNADIKKYVIGSDGAPRLVSVDKTAVGKDISTKAVGSWRRVDLTDTVSHHLPPSLLPHSPPPLSQYKHTEGTDWERRALYFGYEELIKESHDMTFNIPAATYSFGQDVTLDIAMTNKARQHVVKGTVLCEAVDYSGKVHATVCVCVMLCIIHLLL